MKTMMILAALLLAGCINPARSQQQTMPYAPFAVDEKAYGELLTYLRQQPYMFSAPVIGWLEAAEAQAQREAAAKAEEAKKKVEPPPDAPK